LIHLRIRQANAAQTSVALQFWLLPTCPFPEAAQLNFNDGRRKFLSQKCCLFSSFFLWWSTLHEVSCLWPVELLWAECHAPLGHARGVKMNPAAAQLVPMPCFLHLFCTSFRYFNTTM